jgi:hypothetical protein
MQPSRADSAALPTRTISHLALASFADEVVGTLARLLVYVGALALLAILALAGLDRLLKPYDDEPAAKPGWSIADRSHPAFAVSRHDSIEKTASYTILRHPGGGRRDVMRWAGDADRPIAELEIYRPGGEFDTSRTVAAAIGLGERAALEAAGLIDTKFGPVSLFRPSGVAGDASGCLLYLKRVRDPALVISGFSCEGETLPVQRAAVACTLNRLTLLASGNEPGLAELFAHAELKRRDCGPAGSADWLLGADNAQLRGAL